MPIFAAETANKLRTAMKRILLVTAILMANVLSMSAAKVLQPITLAWLSIVWCALIRLTICLFT